MTEDAAWPEAGGRLAAPLVMLAVCTPVARSIAFSVSLIVARCR